MDKKRLQELAGVITEADKSEPMYERAVAEVAKYVVAVAKATFGIAKDQKGKPLRQQSLAEFASDKVSMDEVLDRMKRDVSTKVKEILSK